MSALSFCRGSTLLELILVLTIAGLLVLMVTSRISPVTPWLMLDRDKIVALHAYTRSQAMTQEGGLCLIVNQQRRLQTFRVDPGSNTLLPFGPLPDSTLLPEKASLSPQTPDLCYDALGRVCAPDALALGSVSTAALYCPKDLEEPTKTITLSLHGSSLSFAIYTETGMIQ